MLWLSFSVETWILVMPCQESTTRDQNSVLKMSRKYQQSAKLSLKHTEKMSTGSKLSLKNVQKVSAGVKTQSQFVEISILLLVWAWKVSRVMSRLSNIGFNSLFFMTESLIRLSGNYSTFFKTSRFRLVLVKSHFWKCWEAHAYFSIHNKTI